MRVLALSSLIASVLVAQETPPQPASIKLPAPIFGTFTLEKALKDRQSNRNLTGPALSVQTISQLLWSAQGENRPGTGRRTTPSASARYSLELYVIVSKSEALDEGVYKYISSEHSLLKVKDGNPEKLMGSVEGMQAWIPKCPAVFVFAGVPERFTRNEPVRRESNTYWEAGAAAQGLLLTVVANGLGATVVNGVNLEAVHGVLGLPANEKICVLVPVGRAAASN